LKQYVKSGATAVHAEHAESERYVAHLAVCTVNNRHKLVENLMSEGISTGVHYPYLDTEFPTTQHLDSTFLPVSEAAKTRIVTLPCFPEMTPNEIGSVCAAIEKNHQFFEAR
jgi:dTDP-4-amino-4,6-dideoxygalactose transaminase